ncbi:MAG: glycosyltransferase family 4 protein [Pirellulaceae bacterium]
MKILVVNNMVPFVRGGAEELADHLVRHLRRAGHDADLMRIPFAWDPADRLYDEMISCLNMELWNVDRVIALKFPAYLIPHPNKTMWLVHQFRQAYDLWDSDYSLIPHSDSGTRLRDAIRAADNECFASVNGFYCISPTVQQRLRQFNQMDCQVLYHPLNDPENFQCQSYGDYIFAGGRINEGKRQHLLVEAMQHVTSDAKLIVAGPPETKRDAERLQRIVKQHNLQDKVQLELGLLPRERIANLATNALACAYIPFDEDSLAYVTMESCEAKKLVLSASDAGGVLGLVNDGETGFVSPPTAEELADRIDRIFTDRAKSIRMGEASYANWRDKDINWKNTIQKLAA